jgi:hypothetical protein
MLAAVGCTSMFGRRGLPADPLFANRKPIESPAKAGPSVPLPFFEPVPATNPYSAGRDDDVFMP